MAFKRRLKFDKRIKFKKQMGIMYILLFVVLASLGVGYAYIRSDLSINGTAKVKNARWDIHFTNLNVTTGSVTAETAANIKNDTTVEFAATLENPNDFYEFTVDVVNNSTLDAMIDSCSISPALTTEQKKYLEYKVTYSDGVELAEKQELKVGATETLKVRFSYIENSDKTNYPTEDQTFTVEFNVTYVQATSDAIDKPRPYVYTVNKYDSSATSPKYNAVWLNGAFPASITQYNTASEALTAIATASSKDLPFYLKHKIENGVVTESYVEFVVTEAMAQANSGMVAGTYTLRGEKTYDPDTLTWLVDASYISPYYEANKNAIKTAFGYATNSSRCRESGTGLTSYFDCSVSGLDAFVNADGYETVYGRDSSYCLVNSNGSSYCNW